MPIDIEAFRIAIARIAAHLESRHQMLSDLDGKLGDGDLGLTLIKAFRSLDELKAAFPADLGQALMQMGAATSKVSSSSFGTLMATGLMADAKSLKGETSVDWSRLAELVKTAREAMQARGKANLGDKTVLDALAAIEVATAGINEPHAALDAARQAVDEALAEFRQKPNKIGRARVYADKTIGMDDPGMMAVKVMLDAF